MKKTDVEAYANYEVYTIDDKGDINSICVCGNKLMATIIAKLLTMGAANPNVKVHVAEICCVEIMHDNRWYDVYWRDESGELKSESMS